jgi:hypothetical protein
MNATHTVTVSGKVYHACMSPLCSEIAKDAGLPEATSQRVGRGHTYTYADLTGAQVEDVINHLDSYAVSFADSDDNPTRAEGRACGQARDRIIAAYQGATGKRAFRATYYGPVSFA